MRAPSIGARSRFAARFVARFAARFAMGSLDFHQIIVLVALAASFALFVTDAIRYDAVAILVVLLLAATNCLEPEVAFSNFAHPSVVLVASMYAFAAAVSNSGITGELCNRLFSENSSGGEARTVFRVMLISGLLSSVLSNAAVVATLIPVMGTIARRSNIPASRLLMPMAFGSLLGGMLTVIGTSKNIAVNGVIENLGAEPFALFDFTLFGLALLVVGALYFLGPGRLLLPVTRAEKTLSEQYQVPKFLTEVLVEPGSNLINRSVADLELVGRHDVSLLGLVRHQGEEVMAPGPYNRIRSDDVLILQGEPEAILKLRNELDLQPREAVSVGDTRLVSADVQLVEAVVPATSRLANRKLKNTDFLSHSNLNVLAISRQGDIQPTKIGDIRLSVGDTLLIQGHERDIERASKNRDLIVLGEHQAPKLGRNALLTSLLLIGVLAVAALTKLDISVAALAGALGLVLLKCVRADDVRRSIDWSVLILIGGMLSLGQAFRVHRLDQLVADAMREFSGTADHPLLVIGLLFITTLLLTQVINHVAAAVLMTPVAFALAGELMINDRACFMAVMTGAEFAFMSPVAHQANAMVMGPGDYRYRDFLRCGTPLTVLLVVVATLLIPLFWPLAAR